MNSFDYFWFWKSKLPGRKGTPCRVLARGKMNSVLIEFKDGYKVLTSRYAVRRNLTAEPIKPQQKPQQAGLF